MATQHPAGLRYDFLFAAGFANAALLRHLTWLQAVSSPAYPAFAPTWIGIAQLIAGFLVLFLFALVVCRAADNTGSVKWRAAARYFLFCLTLATFLGLVELQLKIPFRGSRFLLSFVTWLELWPAKLLTGAALAGLGAFLISRQPRATRRVTRGILVLTLPFGMWSAVVLGHYALTHAQKSANRYPTFPPSESKRAIVIVFDELSQAALQFFRDRGERFAGFEALEQNGLSCQNARAPGLKTRSSLPAYTLGKRLEYFCPKALNNPELRLEGTQDTRLWSELPGYFDKGKAQGHSIALVGWFHAYCHVLSAPDFCHSAGFGLFEEQRFSIESVARIVKRAVVNKQARPSRLYYRDASVRQAAEKAIASNADLVFLHLVAPHMSAIGGRKPKRPTPKWLKDLPKGVREYLDNLHLADDQLSSLKQLAAQSARPTAWFITSDHGLHTRSRSAFENLDDTETRIPFWAVLPDQPAPAQLPGPLSTLHTVQWALDWLDSGYNDYPGLIERIRHSQPASVEPLDADIWCDKSKD